MTYFQGFIVAVPEGNREAYRQMAEQAVGMFQGYGATRIVECWSDDVAEGKRTDMKRAVKAERGEAIVFSWIEWPDKATCEAAGKKMEAEMGERPAAMPFDGARMVWAGFDVVHDTGDAGGFAYVDGMVGRVTSGGADAIAAFEAAAAPIFQDKGATRLVTGFSSDIKSGKTTDFLRAVDAAEGDAISFGWIEWPDKATRDAGMGSMMEDARMASLTPAWDGPTAIFGGFVPIVDSART